MMAIPERHSEEHHHHEEPVGAMVPARIPYGPAQIVAMAMGVFFLVTGAVGLARGGVDSWTSPAVEFIGLGMTPLLAAIHMVVGIVAMVGAASRLDARATSMFFGTLLIAAGIVALVQSVDALSWTTGNGIAYLIIGIVAILAATYTAMIVRQDRVIAR